MEPLRIVLVDDQVLFRRGLAHLLEHYKDIQIVGEAKDGLEALTCVRETMPDIVLMDIGMPYCNGIEATRRIKRELPNTRIVMLTVSDDNADLFEAIKSGAQGYLLKNLEPHQLYEMLQNVSRGEAPLSGIVAAKILEEFSRQESTPQQEEPIDALSRREIEILQLIADGKNNKEIATALSLAESTVKTHLRNILEKLHLETRIQAAVYAIRKGLVDPASRHD